MDARIEPRPLAGTLPAIPSKSVAHRMLICAALADAPTEVACPASSADIDATAACLVALGAGVERTAGGFRVAPRPAHAQPAAPLDCGESGSTLRFVLPVVGALGCGGELTGRGRLAERPLSPLYEEMVAAGCDLSEQGSFPLRVSGRLRAGQFELPGDVSSQYVTGLLLAAPLMGGEALVRVAEPLQSRPYVDITVRAMRAFGVEVEEAREEGEGGAHVVFRVAEGARYASPGAVAVEGDWSNAAFWLAAGALGEAPVAVTGLDLSSPQGDRAILAALAMLGARASRQGDRAAVSRDRLHGAEIDVRDFPDLVPPIAAVAALAEGTTRLTHAERLRLKESDRLESVSACIRALGGRARVEGDDLVVEGVEHLAGGEVDAMNDHRICMEAAVLATRCEGPVTIRGAECVGKSYPGFFEDYARLGGRVGTRG